MNCGISGLKLARQLGADSRGHGILPLVNKYIQNQEACPVKPLSQQLNFIWSYKEMKAFELIHHNLCDFRML